MKSSFRQRLLIAVGISAGILASFNLFAQNTPNQPSAAVYTINSQSEYQMAVSSIQDLASKLYSAHVKYPALAYSHVYNNDGSLMGFTVTGVPQSAEADKISSSLMELELLGKAINSMDLAYVPDSKDKLSSKISKKKAVQNLAEAETVMASAHPGDFIASNR